MNSITIACMNDQAFTTLEYEPLLALVRRYAQTPMGAMRLEKLTPLADLNELHRALAAVSEASGLRERGVKFSFTCVVDPKSALARLHIEDAALDPLSILQVARVCEQALAARSAIQPERDAFPVLWEVVSGLPRELNSLVARVTNKILPSGEVDDRASPELARIRHDIARLRSHITRSLENLMRKQEEAIQDALVTVRNDRFVIPVRSDHRSRVQGVAHGFSSSGATIFVEPMETIDANNELQLLKETEEKEIARILLELSDTLRRELPSLESASRAVEELDFISAKVSFQQRFDGVIPEISDDEDAEALELIEARHPLLVESLRASGDPVVPVSFSLDGENTAMVISGANAGGKTVVLKTAGLLSLMALSGLPVPAKKGRFPFYRSVLADIGDHQSLAANLSTFTSHAANISRMIAICEAPALVLLDEVGTGTDPEEGSALGVAVVDHFRRFCQAHVLATTHYSGLKMYAANEARVLNASVEFDQKTLQPTYRLIVGVAGASSGLEIARRFGLPNDVIAAAADLVEDSTLQATEYLRRIKKEAEEAHELRLALQEERTAVAEKFASLDFQARRRERDRQSEFESALHRTIEEFERSARALVSGIQERAERIKAEREAQKLAAELKREAKRVIQGQAVSGSETSIPSRPVRVVRDGQSLNRFGTADTNEPVKALRPAQEERYKTASEARPLKVGDRVRLRSFGSIGIIDQLKGEEAEVRVKALRFREKLDNLERVEEVEPDKRESGKLASLRSSSASELRLKTPDGSPNPELNVIGQTTDEAVDAVDKFLDEASLASLSQVRIVHGHGTGALRRAIGELLRGHPHVMRFSAAPPNQGGAGATVVELRQ
ncbi:MAG TPA: Smr/MutS family protein [Pyrinomonadaceae bacterium]|nr:Smr/MutS family protein [Pyrinomonadaceae bacterium]